MYTERSTPMLDNSQISTYQTCPMKYYLKYVKGYEKDTAAEENVDLVFGQFFHKFLENRYKKETLSADEIWRNYPVFPGEQIKTREAGIFLSEQYEKEYVAQDTFEVLDVEFGITFDVGSTPFIVKVDTVVRIGENIFGLEHKTTGKIWNNYFERYFINSQISAQCHAISQKYGHCEGIILNACEIGTVKKEVLLDEGDSEIESYQYSEKRYSKYYGQDKIYCSGLRARFERSIINRTKSELSEWYENAKGWAIRINNNILLNDYLRSDASGACSLFRGCTYKEICKSSVGMALDEQIIEQLYTVKADPLDYLGLTKGD